MQAAWLALPRREPYFCPTGQIYAEAESNANEFALTCTGPTREGGLGLMTMEEPYMHASRMACIAEA